MIVKGKGWKEIFYLTMHSTQFSYGFMALDIWYRIIEIALRGNRVQPLHRLLFSIAARDLYMHHPIDRIVHTTTFVKPVLKHWLE